MSEEYREKRVRVMLSHGEIAHLCRLLDRDLDLRSRRGEARTSEYRLLLHLRKKLGKHWSNMGYWDRHKFKEWQSVHGQLWARKQPAEIPEEPKREFRREYELGYICGRLQMVKPRPEDVEAFAEEYPFLAKRLETDDKPFMFRLYNETERGGEAWLDLVLGKYRLRLTKKYANLFRDFCRDREQY